MNTSNRDDYKITTKPQHGFGNTFNIKYVFFKTYSFSILLYLKNKVDK